MSACDNYSTQLKHWPQFAARTIEPVLLKGYKNTFQVFLLCYFTVFDRIIVEIIK